MVAAFSIEHITLDMFEPYVSSGKEPKWVEATPGEESLLALVPEETIFKAVVIPIKPSIITEYVDRVEGEIDKAFALGEVQTILCRCAYTAIEKLSAGLSSLIGSQAFWVEADNETSGIKVFFAMPEVIHFADIAKNGLPAVIQDLQNGYTVHRREGVWVAQKPVSITTDEISDDTILKALFSLKRLHRCFDSKQEVGDMIRDCYHTNPDGSGQHYSDAEAVDEELYEFVEVVGAEAIRELVIEGIGATPKGIGGLPSLHRGRG